MLTLAHGTVEALDTSLIETLAPAVIALPLLGAIVLLFFGKRIGPASGALATTMIGMAFAGGVVIFLKLLGIGIEHDAHHNARAVTVDLFEWIQAGRFRVGASLLVDQLSVAMVLVVTGVGTLIHIYSTSYMAGDERYPRFFAYLNLFVASMLLLVLSDNLLLMYVGWEGVGLCSYLLIGFWFEKPSASNAAKKAFIVNRIGDFSFLIGIFVIAIALGTVTLGQINAQAGALGSGLATIAALLLFGGATGKSAQIPLYVWLPDAMEGPTPVSALIHAATMVTAGVYMVARLFPVFEVAGDALTVVGWIGAGTALFAGVMAAFEYDIKRVLAYSTVSQLGYMFLALGVGAPSFAIFHLVTHAFFKALMFLGAGAVMHGLNNEVDMRNMGGLRKVMPITGWTFMAGWLAIAGIVPFAGFFSKDAILAAAWADHQYALWAVGIVTAALTAYYMSRLYLRVFEGRLKVPEGAHPHDATMPMAAALVPLAVLSVVGGAINLPGILTFEHFLEPVLGAAHEPEGIVPYLLAGGALFVAVAGILAARALYMGRASGLRRRRLEARFGTGVMLARNKFYVDEIYGRTIVLPAKRLALYCANVVDRRWIDGVIMGAGRMVAGLGDVFRRSQTGYVRSYAASILLGVVVLFSVLMLRVTAS